MFKKKLYIYIGKEHLIPVSHELCLYISIPADLRLHLRLAIHMILCGNPSGFATVWGTVCSSWVALNAYTSCRSALLPEGDEGKTYIKQANCMVSRILTLQADLYICMFM